MISIIIPTIGTRKTELNRLLTSLENQSNNDFEIIIVSQDNHEDVTAQINQVSIKDKINHVKLHKKGLSYSRNEGMKHVNGDIVTFSDDDCWYPEDAVQNVYNYFKDHPKTGVSCYQIFDPTSNEFYKKYQPQAQEKVNFQELFRKSSIEIFVNLKVVEKSDVKFDEDFGLGAKYPSGEENVFLTDLQKRGYEISYEPSVIVYHPKKESSAFLSENQFLGKGPMFKRIYGPAVAFGMYSAFFAKKYGMLDKPFRTYFKGLRELKNYHK